MQLGATSLDVHPLCLGGNVFGRSADEAQSFQVLDAYVAAGGNFIDTANTYADGASEQIIGRWMKARGNRDEIVLATKVGMGERPGLSPARIEEAIDESLRRLQTDRVDLYYAHEDDPHTDFEQTLATFDRLQKAGKIKHLAASKYSASRLHGALEVSRENGFPRYEVFQVHYNLVVRDEYEGAVQDLCVEAGVAALPFFSLAQGFLTGKYRPGGPPVQSHRSGSASAYIDERGLRVLDALDEVAGDRNVPLAAVALAWLKAQPGVATPVASARTVEQLTEIVAMADLSLNDSELQRLTDASN